MEELQKRIKDVYDDIFPNTPQSERIEDITKQFFKLVRNTGVKDLKESTGNLISSLIQLANESDWSIKELIDDNLTKILNSSLQYKSLGRRKRIAIYGGSFSPITNGHIQVAKFVLDNSSYFDEVWLTPSYNSISGKNLVDSQDRLKMCELSAKDTRIKVFDYEIINKLSGETFKLIKLLKNDINYENYDFSFIIGLDNANTFNKWVNFEHLEKMCSFVVVPRKGIKIDKHVDWYLKKPHIYLNDKKNDLIEVSSTQVRNILKVMWNSKFTLIDELTKYIDIDVLKYIKYNNLYK